MIIMVTNMKKTEYEKLRTKIIGVLEGLTLANKEFFNVRKALVYAEKIHCHQRKDGTPEFSHQLEMLGIALSFHALLLNPYDVYMAIILHDTIEDYPEYQQEIHEIFPDVVKYSRILSKFTDSVRGFQDPESNESTYYEYFDNISNCEVCSVVKLIDRVHNLSTAPGVFSTNKIEEYCNEVDKYFIDMMKNSKDKFNQRTVYEILKFMLQTEVNTIRAFLNTIKKQEEEERNTVSAIDLINRLKVNP